MGTAKPHVRPEPGRARGSEVPPEIAAHLGAIVGYLLAAVRTELGAREGADADPLVRSDRLGPNNRIVLALIKRSEIAAVKIGPRWHVRRSSWDRYIAELEQKQRAASAAESAPANYHAPAEGDPEADVDHVLEELGLERRPVRSAVRRGR